MSARSRLVVPGGFIVVTASAFAVSARMLEAQGSPAPVAELAVEQQVHDRWMHGHQQPRFTPFADSREWLVVDSLRHGSTGERRLYLTMGRSAAGRDSALVVFRADGSISRLEASARPPIRAPVMLPGDSARFARMRFVRNGRLTLPESRLWDLVPTFRVANPRPGARWTDTIVGEADYEGYRQAVRGVRSSTIVGDTTVDGRRLWLVRDSARVRYEERWLVEERTLDTLAGLTRTVTGVVRGSHWYDPEIGLDRARADTTTLSGETVLTYPARYDGPRMLRTPVRYERYRRWVVYEPAAYAARQGALRDSVQRTMGGMVMVANTDVERRLAAGDSAVRDSVLTEWQRAADPGERERLFGLVRRWGVRDPRQVDRLDSMRVASGDTVFLYELLARRAYRPGMPVDSAALSRMLPFMRDPGLAFAFNASRDWLYENLRQGLLASPPAATPDTAHWACSPVACRMLADQWRIAREPRLRQVGLVALLVMDPAQWADTVITRAGAGERFLEPAAMLARGVGSAWPASAKHSLPGPNAEWQAWADWMTAVDSTYAAMYAAAARAGGFPPPPRESRVRFEESHATAIRFFQARTGRDVVGELRRGYEQAASDSARLVFGAMLQGLGELRLSAEEIAADVRSNDPGRRVLAERALRKSFRQRTDLADSATTVLLLDRLLALIVEGTPAWRALTGGPGSWARQGPDLHHNPNRGAIYVLADSLPAALRAKWKDRVQFVTAREWAARPLTEGGVLYTLSNVRRSGVFAFLGVTVSERIARREGEAPRLYAAGSSYYLMEVNGEWMVVAQDAWVT